MAPQYRMIAGRAPAWSQLLKTRNIGWLWAGQVVSQVGDGLSKVALLFFVYELTGSALKMTVIGVLQTIPPLFLGPFAGVYIDRLPKRAVMIVIDLVRAGLLITIPVLYAIGWLTLPWLYMLVFIVALFAMAFGPALNAAIPLLVQKTQLTRANAVMQSSMTIGQLLGPALSGLLIALIGSQNVLYVNALAFIISALCMLPIRIPYHTATRRSPLAVRPIFHELSEGFRFVFVRQRLLLPLMISAALFTMGSTAFVYLLPVLGDRVWNIDSVHLGWLWSALSVGIMIATGWLASMKPVELCRRFWIIVGAALVGGLSIFAVTWTMSLVLIAGLIILIGGGSGLVLPVVSASLQELTPHKLLARVFSVFNTGTMALAMLGMTIIGWSADKYPPTRSLLVIAGIQIGTAVATALLVPWCYRLCSPNMSQNPKRLSPNRESLRKAS
ncbi:MAG: MFS transporter [Nitrospiraceae bacterium]